MAVAIFHKEGQKNIIGLTPHVENILMDSNKGNEITFDLLVLHVSIILHKVIIIIRPCTRETCKTVRMYIIIIYRNSCCSAVVSTQ